MLGERNFHEYYAVAGPWKLYGQGEKKNHRITEHLEVEGTHKDH